MAFHAADHDKIVKWLLGILVAYLIQDTLIYLIVGNMYYCHTETGLRNAAIYNMTVDKGILRAQQVSEIHGIYDFSYFLILIFLAIF